jgi:hypothetical protein
MHGERLEDGNFVLYAAKYYDNPQCSDTAEFYDDLNRFKYLKRLFNRYEADGDLKERLILNHIIVLYNVFGQPAATRMLFFKLEGQWHLLKPFLIMLGYMPDQVIGIGTDNKTIIGSDIPMNMYIVNVLRNI